MRKSFLLIALMSLALFSAIAQPDRWQQHVKYNMDVDLDVVSNRFGGTQQLAYTNNSPDTLRRVFYHLYWNAFQPNSMMDTRSRHLGEIQVNGRPDWDGRVTDRILHLQPDEIGYLHVKWIKLNGVLQATQEHETILEVTLSKPILPHSTVQFSLEFEGQVPLQVRRSGRDNPQTGVRYSMSQWYPKICEYDYEGWHPTPYVAREFYGVWGDYSVNISIDKNYLVGGSGYLLNAQAIGQGYETPGTRVPAPRTAKVTWHFDAPNVHDFMWAADPEFRHLSRQAYNGTTINVIYNRDSNFLARQFAALPEKTRGQYGNSPEKYLENWDSQWNKVLEGALIVLPFIETHFGKYPYKQYSFVHGGDGGMEYPMATLISGPSLGTAFHEWMHSWYQMMLGTNESEYAWMDEGFTSYAESLVMEYYNAAIKYKAASPDHAGLITRKELMDSLVLAARTTNPHLGAYQGYFFLVKSGLEEPMTTHADHFETNFAYSIAAYSKGEIFMEQLGYITGAATRDRILAEYYRQWRFKHPNVNDLIQVAEKVSGLKLDWYREYFVNTTKTIDYSIDSLWEEGGKTRIRLANKGKMPMPIDLQLSFKDGSREMHYIPQYLMFGSKPAEDGLPRKVYPEWKWTHPYYIIETDRKLADITLVEIDPSQRMADVNRKDNRLEIKW